MQYFCAKDNCETDLDKGCRHPNDFCQHRTACMVHFLEQEEKKGRKEVTDRAGDQQGAGEDE